MKHVRLKQLSLVNFKGIKEREIDFSEETNICGANATGKSTLFDAFIWLLFGKDQFDRKDHNIWPIENGVVVDRVDSEVSGILDVDGQEITLKRVLHQKWVRKRGKAVETFEGSETRFYIDGVKCGTAGEYKAKVDSIIDETVFKLITNPTFFFSQKWEIQREHLFRIVGTLSDEEVAAMKPEFSQLLEAISGKSFKEFKAAISEKKKKLNDDLKEIPSRIDQTRRLMPEKEDFEALQTELSGVENDLADVNKGISDKAAAIRTQYEGIQAKQTNIGNLRGEQQSIVQKAKQAAQNEAFEKNSARNELNNQRLTAQADLSTNKSLKEEAQRHVDFLKARIAEKERSLAGLRQMWQEENEREYQQQEGCLVCPILGGPCGDPAAKSSHAEAQTKAKAAFAKKKEEKLAKINEEGGELKASLGKDKTALVDAEKELAEKTESFLQAEKLLEDLTKQYEQTSVVEPVPVIPQELAEWVKAEEEIQRIEKEIQEVKPVDDQELQDKRKALESRRDELKTQLSKKSLIEKYEKEIEALEVQSGDLSQQIADLEQKEFLLADFTKTKINECEQRINKLFSVVRFDLFDKTIEGSEFPACIAKNKAGVPISATNTAEKVNAGLDVINTLCRFHNVTAPIFIDGRESVNRLIPTESQIINLVVTQDKSLIIN